MGVGLRAEGWGGAQVGRHLNPGVCRKGLGESFEKMDISTVYMFYCFRPHYDQKSKFVCFFLSNEIRLSSRPLNSTIKAPPSECFSILGIFLKINK